MVAAVVVLSVATIAACLGPSLSSTEQPAIVIQQGSSINLGNIMVGSTGSGSVTISPASGSQSSTDTITMVTKGSCPGWALQLAGLPATVTRSCNGSGSSSAQAIPDGDSLVCVDTTYSFGVSYTPTVAGSSSCTITISGSTFSPISTVANANGLGQALAMEVLPKVINFGDVRVGNSGSQSLDIRNAGTSPLMISGVTINPTTSYTITNIVNNPISPSKTESLTVTCQPLATGQFDSTVTVSGSAGSQSVGLKCKGINSNLILTPSPLDLTVRVGELVEKDITIQNVGASATLTSITIVPTVANVPVTIVSGPPPGATLGSGSSTNVRIRFAPTAPQAQTELAKLRINHDAAMIRDVVINGAAQETTMAVFPDTVEFGPVCAGTTETMDVDVKAGTVGSFRMSGFSPPASPFLFTAKSGTILPGNALGNEGNKLEFLATIAAGDPGPVMGEVTLDTDIPDDKAHKLTLKAEVLPGGVGASPQTMDFGGVVKNTLSQAMSTEVRNCSDAPLVIDDVHIEGVNAADFSIVIPGPNEQKVTLEPHESISYHVVLRADVAGAKVATLVVASGASSVRVGLVATALGGGDGGLTGERSYYTCGDCNSGDGAGLYVFVVVIGLRLRRRRK